MGVRRKLLQTSVLMYSEICGRRGEIGGKNDVVIIDSIQFFFPLENSSGLRH